MSRTQTVARCWSGIALVALFSTSGCGETQAPEAVANTGDDRDNTTEGGAPKAPVNEQEQSVDAFLADYADNLTHHFQAHFGRAGRSAALKTTLEAKVRKKGDPFRRRDLLKALYQGADGEVLSLDLIARGELTDRGKIVFEVLGKADAHALNPARYHCNTIEEQLPSLAEHRQTFKDWKASPLTGEELKKIKAALGAADFGVDDPKAAEKTTTMLLHSQSPVARLSKEGEDLKASSEALGRAEAMMELLLAEGLLLYTWDMRYHNEHWFRDVDLPRAQKVRERDQKARERKLKLEEMLVDAVRKATEDGLQSFVDNLPPHFDQYARVMEALARYRGFKEKGGWQEVKKLPIRRGGKHERLKALKERMAVEGYYTPPEDQKDELSIAWDTNLREGIKLYQTTHQLRITGESSKPFWISLNTSLDDRIRQIELTLQRWRESRIGHDKTFIHVNVPDFHAEGWSEGERKMRFRIVAGNTQQGCDRKRKIITYVNATPMISDMIEAVILNPYWNIPERILKEEILPEYLKNPEYLTEHNYECVKEREGVCVRMRQQGGEGNALGQVKFIFPNEHGVYMHDTPKKAIFNYPVRAYSHGCMRVHEPLQFAEYLLKEDKNYNKRLFDKWMEEGKENSIRLNTPVPIHVEYYTVRVDDEGRANFLSDIYKYDRDRLSGEVIKPRKCEPSAFDDFVLNPEEEEGQEGEEIEEGDDQIDLEEGGDEAEGEEDKGEDKGEGDEKDEGDDKPKVPEEGDKAPPKLLAPKGAEKLGEQAPVPLKLRKLKVSGQENNPEKGDDGP